MSLHTILVVDAHQESLRAEASQRRLVATLPKRPSLIKRFASFVAANLVSSSYGAPAVTT
jgi:hypothetical protein